MGIKPKDEYQQAALDAANKCLKILKFDSVDELSKGKIFSLDECPICNTVKEAVKKYHENTKNPPKRSKHKDSGIVIRTGEIKIFNGLRFLENIRIEPDQLTLEFLNKFYSCKYPELIEEDKEFKIVKNILLSGLLGYIYKKMFSGG